MTGDFYNIRAGVVFEYNGFRPVWFSRNGGKVIVKEICYKWVEKIAGAVIYKFTVYDGTDYFELQLNSNDMRWHIVQG